MFPSKALRILDVGTRDGYAIELFKKVGYTAMGIDIDKEYLKHAEKQGRNVRHGDIMDISTLKDLGKWDVIFSRHCMEHCANTRQFFESCKYLLNENGYLFLTFPIEKRGQHKNPKHLVSLQNKGGVRKHVPKEFKEIFFGHSRRKNIRGRWSEYLYVAQLVYPKKEK
jgi:2-polyprenyl-3-methyl-5-hydroxy-6-metoxy-1,4-benzoquinol methylase